MTPYFAVGAATTAIKMLGGMGALVSYAWLGTTLIPHAKIPELRKATSRLFLDSGAFTAWTKGRPVLLDAYVAFIRENLGTYDTIAALDDIESSDQSVVNYDSMRAALPEAVDRLVPVFHEGESALVLDYYVDHAPLVGLGRTEGRRSKDKTLAWYDFVFNRHPTLKAHAFGNGDPATLEPYPFKSFDCSTWERDAAYSVKHGWPWSRCSKEVRQRAYIEAFATIEHRPVGQTSLVFGRAEGTP